MALENENLYRRNPEIHFQNAEAARGASFEEAVKDVDPKVILKLLEGKDGQLLLRELEQANWPTDEKTCDQIAIRQGLGVEHVAAVSKYQKGRFSGDTSIH